jgi:uncharacterized protein YjeT (DUF2065 family)
MDLTIFLAQVIGIYLLITGLSALMYPGRVEKATKEFARSHVLPYFDGALALIFGLLVVLTHNVWGENLATTLITALGWIGIFEGATLMLMPQASITSVARKVSGASTAKFLGILALAIGIYLTWFGFLAA